MEFDGRIRLRAERTAVWELLLDPNRLAACLAGVEEVRRVDEQTFEGVIAASVGPVSGKFSFHAQIAESRPPADMVAHMEGVDSVTKSTLTTDVFIGLDEPAAQQTELTYRAVVNVKGRLAILGDMILRATASLMLEEFARRLRGQLAAEHTADWPPPPASPSL
ncbi:MAG: CoxG family protein [Chloroflexota bacterium]